MRINSFFLIYQALKRKKRKFREDKIFTFSNKLLLLPLNLKPLCYEKGRNQKTPFER